MKKLIKGARYDTSTARQLAWWENMGDKASFSYYKESLFRTKAGKYFVYGEGNAASPYAKDYGQNELGSGEEIRPLSEEAARKWAEEKLDADEYEEIFGQIDSSEMVAATVYIPQNLAEKIALRMEEEHCSRNKLILEAIKEYLK